MKIAVRARLEYDVTAPASFVFSLAPVVSDRQRVLTETLTCTPEIDVRHLDDDGNRLLVLSCDPGGLTVGYDAVIALEPFVPAAEPADETAFGDLPVEAYPYLRPSRYCESDRLARFAMRTFGSVGSGAERVQRICDWVYGHLDYVPGSTDASSTALDVFHASAGVCRDFSHLSIALCRALGIPARYVSGYAVDLDPPDFHGFFEAFVGGRWYLFDATQMSAIDRLVRIATGRDAADVAFATFTGEAYLTRLDVSAVAAGEPDPPPGSAPDATTVSTA